MNAPPPMLVTPFGIVTPVRLGQPLNAPPSMLVTLLPIVTLVRLVPENAQSPMLVTGRELIALGMVTTPPGPVYPVTVIVPLLVTKMNWACTAAGSVNSSSSGAAEAAMEEFRLLDSLPRRFIEAARVRRSEERRVGNGRTIRWRRFQQCAQCPD